MFNLKNIDLFKAGVAIVVIGGIVFIYSQQLKIKELAESNQKKIETLKSLNETLEKLDKNLERTDDDLKGISDKLEEIENKQKELENTTSDLKKKDIELEKKVSSKELARKNSLLASKQETKVKSVVATKPVAATKPVNKETTKPSDTNNNTANKETESNNNTKGTPITMTLTYYGELSGVCADGSKVSYGAIASNVYPMGTKFNIGGEIFTVRDRGGKNFNSYNRLDVFIPRKSGESNSAYRSRLLALGRKTVTAYRLN